MTDVIRDALCVQIRDLRAELDAVKSSRDGLMNAIIQEYRNGPLSYRVVLPGVWPGTPGDSSTYAPGRWDTSGDYWCYQRREDAVEAVVKYCESMTAKKKPTQG